MADAKITALPALTTPSSDDVLVIVDDPSGSPVTDKITYANLFSNVGTVTGGTTTTSTLTLKSTSGVGTTNADIIFQVGNNGATEAMRILNSGNVGIATSNPLAKLHVTKTITTNNSDSYAIKMQAASDTTVLIMGPTSSGAGYIQAMDQGVSWTTRPLILQSQGGKVGIGTSSTPVQALEVNGSIALSWAASTQIRWNYTGGGTYRIGIELDSGGRGMNIFSNMADTGNGFVKIVTGSGSGSTSVTVNGSNAVAFNQYTAGTLVTDSSGNITVSSDERLKNIQASFKPGLKEVMNINPILFKYNKNSGMETENTYAGFSAQNVKKSIPQAVFQDSRGYYSLQDRPIIAALVNAVKELEKKIAALENKRR